MYNIDHYFDFDSPPKSIVKSKKKKQQQQQMLLLLLLSVGAAYYFMIYLPDEERKLLESQIQTKLDEVKNIKPEEHANIPTLLTACQEVRKLANILVGRYQEDAKSFPKGDADENFHFTRAGSYDVHFPPSLQEYYDKAKSPEINHANCDPDPTTKKDNNAIFFGAGGTGKTATVKKICIEADSCPLVIVKGSSLTPTKQDYDAEDNKDNQEIRYILFVDECDQISNNSLIHDPNKLRFLKECLEGSDTSRKYEKEFKKYFDDASASPEKYKLPSGFNIPPMPQRWRDNATLNEEDNNNPDSQYETEEDEVNDEGEKTGNKMKIDIEIGEFLKFFWQKKESGQLGSYDGKFEPPSNPKVEDVLDGRIPEMSNILAQSSNLLNQSLANLCEEVDALRQQMQLSTDSENTTTIVATVAVGIATGGTSLAVQAAAIGGAYLVGSAIDSDNKKKENENKQLNLKGEISKQIRDEINNLQNDRSNEASQLNNLDQQIAQKQNKLNDPNVSETEKAQIRSELASLVSQRSSIQTRIKTLDEKIEGLIKQGNKTITSGGGLSSLEIDYNTKLIIGAIIFLVIYFAFIKEKEKD
ncbi:15961_t:CDS:2 [Funneliformis geosporum]|uniref:15961_t:CDS:1 n=1 Tax=Funneliformis geosporum TaxID=1117311 RepID=A0A9W4WU28_9GLOM|nr:15961_t:CDS:2 [Funneliformis geosporum]